MISICHHLNRRSQNMGIEGLEFNFVSKPPIDILARREEGKSFLTHRSRSKRAAAGECSVCRQCHLLYGAAKNGSLHHTKSICGLFNNGRCVAGEGASGSVRIGMLHQRGPIQWRARSTSRLEGDPTCPVTASGLDSPLVAVKLIHVPINERRRLNMAVNESRLLRQMTINFDDSAKNEDNQSHCFSSDLGQRPQLHVPRLFALRNVIDNGFLYTRSSNVRSALPLPTTHNKRSILVHAKCTRRERRRAARKSIPKPPPPSKPSQPHGNLTACIAIVPTSPSPHVNNRREKQRIGTSSNNNKNKALEAKLPRAIPTQYCHHRASFILEYADGGTLQHYVESVGALPPRHASALFFPILLGLDHLHNAMHTIHRDIKPSNILLCREDSGVNARPPFVDSELWRVKLADFGIAKSDVDAKTICGTRTYMAPEVRNAMLLARIAGSRSFVQSAKGSCFTGTQTQYGLATDIYSLGVVLQFMLSGGVHPALGAKWILPSIADQSGYVTNTQLGNTGSEKRIASHFSSWAVPVNLTCTCAPPTANANASQKLSRSVGLCETCGKITRAIATLVNAMTNNDPSERPTIQQLFMSPFVAGHIRFRQVGLDKQREWAASNLNRRSAMVCNYLDSEPPKVQTKYKITANPLPRQPELRIRKPDHDQRDGTMLSLFPGLIFEPICLKFLSWAIKESPISVSSIREAQKARREAEERNKLIHHPPCDPQPPARQDEQVVFPVKVIPQAPQATPPAAVPQKTTKKAPKKTKENRGKPVVVYSKPLTILSAIFGSTIKQ